MGHWDIEPVSDEWYTPPHVFEALGCRFDLDPASPKGNKTFVPADHYINADSLNIDWRQIVPNNPDPYVFLNPPYGGRNEIIPWLEKFIDHGNGITLTPDRTSAPWFRMIWRKSDMVLFTPKLKFYKPDGTTGKSPSNGSALFAIGKRGVDALINANKRDLGIIGLPKS